MSKKVFIAHEKKKTRVPVMDRNCKKIKKKTQSHRLLFQAQFPVLTNKNCRRLWT